MFNCQNKKSESGFTLIELLIVILVISILSGVVVSVINAGQFRAKARDSQRVADLKKIQTALELYYADYRSYPVTVAWVQVTGTGLVSTALEAGYINAVPTDPGDTSCANNGPLGTLACQRYNYLSSADGYLYILTSIMEVESSNDSHMCGDLNNWATVAYGATLTTEDYCYGVENP